MPADKWLNLAAGILAAPRQRLAGCLLPLTLALPLWAQTPAPYQTNPWTFIGPQPVNYELNGNLGALGGPVAAIAADPSNSLTAYIGAWDGGVWVTTDQGLTWKPLTDSQSNLAIGALAVAPSNQGVVYAGTGTTAISGANFAGNGLLVTTNGGASWTLEGQSYFAGLAITHIVINPQFSQNLLVSAAALPGSAGLTGGLYSSSDGGATWQLLLSGNCRDFNWLPQQQQIIADSNGNLMFSSNNGQSFAKPKSGDFSGYLRVAFAASAAAPDTIWALTMNTLGGFGGLYKSSDGGNDWVLLNVPASFSGSLFDTSQNGNDLALAADPNQAGGLYAGGVDLWYSGDSGVTWKDLSNSGSVYVHSGQHAISFGPGSSPTLWLANDGGVWNNLNASGGQGFVNCNATLAVVDISNFAASGPTLLAASPMEGFAEMISDNIAWNAVAPGLTAGSAGLAAGGENAAYALSKQAQSLDEATSASAIFQPLFESVPNPSQDSGIAAQNPPLWVDPGNSQLLYLATDQLWTSLDGGLSWTDVDGSTANTTISALAAAPPLLAEGSMQGQVLISTNNGASWSAFDGSSSLLPNRPVTGLAWTTSGTLVASFGGLDTVAPTGHVFEYNGGWSNISGNLADSPVTALVADPLDSQVLYAANGLGVWATPDNGAHWLQLGAGLPGSQVDTLALRPKARLLLAGSEGRGVWSFALQPDARTAKAISGDNQTGDVSTLLPLTLQVQVLNAFGDPLSGMNIAWSDNGAGGSFSPSQPSDSQGLVSTTYTLPAAAGAIQISATPAVSSGTVYSAEFQETAVAVIAAGLLPYSGNNQTQAVNLPLPVPLVVEVQDSLGNPVSGFTVNFSDNGAGGAFSATSVVSDAMGMASSSYTMPPNPGTVTINASGGNLTAAQFTETASVAPDFSLSMTPATQNADENTIVQIALNSQAIGGDSQTILLTCAAPTTGCTINPSSIAPGKPSTVSIGSGSLSVGDNTISVSGTDGQHTHYASATIDVIAPAINLQAASTATTIAAGQTANFSLSLSGAGGFNGQATLACSNSGGPMPYGMGCSIDPSQPNLGPTAITVNLAINTTAPGVFPPVPYTYTDQGPDPAIDYEIEILLVLAMAGLISRRRGLRLAGTALLAAGLLACGGGSGTFYKPPPAPGTPSGTYNIMVTAAATGVTTQQTTLTVTVN